MLIRRLILAFFATSVLTGFATSAVAGQAEQINVSSFSTTDAGGASFGSTTFNVSGYAQINGGRKVYISVYSKGADGKPKDLIRGTDSTTNVSGNFSIPKTYSLPPGDYFLMVIFTKPDGMGGEAVIDTISDPFTIKP